MNFISFSSPEWEWICIPFSSIFSPCTIPPTFFTTSHFVYPIRITLYFIFLIMHRACRDSLFQWQNFFREHSYYWLWRWNTCKYENVWYLRERIDGKFRYGEDLVGGDEATAVAIELTKPLVERHYLLLWNWNPPNKNKNKQIAAVNESTNQQCPKTQFTTIDIDLRLCTYMYDCSALEPLRCRTEWASKMYCPLFQVAMR